MIKEKNSIVGRSADHLVQHKRNQLLHQLVDSLDNLDNRVTSLEDTMRINGAQEYEIHEKGKSSAVKALGGKKTPAYKKLSRKVFGSLWSEFKRYFDIPRYGELPAKRYHEGVKFVETWLPKQELRMEIDTINAQKGDM